MTHTFNNDYLNSLGAEKDFDWKKDTERRKSKNKELTRSRIVAVRILDRLRSLNMTQKQLADRMNVKPQQVNKWVKGDNNFTFDTISKIEDSLDIQIIEIIFNTNEVASKPPLVVQTFDYEEEEVGSKVEKGSCKVIPMWELGSVLTSSSDDYTEGLIEA